ncbi:uncharacterized protein LOC131020768 [Salvia miltiorrhiza]|uniref:uncharacterized protein LOC131020768 n=1 Tax=Salvia miltiorrhiza TaxID=226208 RepID=UPI0025AD2DDA|nr:uncharacterized protein LOC131020768 [Salvia miltiorrhiza]
MENSQALATESFSYSWLVVAPPPPNLRRVENGGGDDDNFHFDVPSSAEFANADEIFSEGRIRTEAAAAAAVAPAAAAADRNRCCIVGKWSKKFLRTCLGFVRCSSKSSRVDDLQRKVLEASSPPSSSIVDLGGCDYEYYCLKMDKNSWRSSPTSTSSYVCCDDDNADESSIREAILYCKRSIEK